MKGPGTELRRFDPQGYPCCCLFQPEIQTQAEKENQFVN